MTDYKFKPCEDSFKGGLRKHTRITNYARAYNPNGNSVDIEQYLNWYTPKSQNIFTNRARNQRELTNKLSPTNKQDWRQSRLEMERSVADSVSPARQKQ